jgi:hypothetical protein
MSMALATTAMIMVTAVTVDAAGVEAAMGATGAAARDHVAVDLALATRSVEEIHALVLALAEESLTAKNHAPDPDHAELPEGLRDSDPANHQSLAKNLGLPRNVRNPRSARSLSHARRLRSAKRARPPRSSFVTLAPDQDRDLTALVAAAATKEEAAPDPATILAAHADMVIIPMVTKVLTLDIE